MLCSYLRIDMILSGLQCCNRIISIPFPEQYGSILIELVLEMQAELKADKLHCPRMGPGYKPVRQTVPPTATAAPKAPVG